MNRGIQLAIGGAIIFAILVAILYQGTQTTVFFYTPAEILAAPEEFRGKTIRIGALVEQGSTNWNPERVRLQFRVSEDSRNFIPVVFNGVKPDLFREGQGVVVEGRLDGKGTFQAGQVLVKHSEEYKVDTSQVQAKEALYRSLEEN